MRRKCDEMKGKSNNKSQKEEKRNEKSKFQVSLDYSLLPPEKETDTHCTDMR